MMGTSSGRTAVEEAVLEDLHEVRLGSAAGHQLRVQPCRPQPSRVRDLRRNKMRL